MQRETTGDGSLGGHGAPMQRGHVFIAVSGAAVSLIFAATVACAAPSLPRHAVFGAAIADGKGGVVVERAISGSPAALAGIRAGDVITSLDDVPTATVQAFLSAVKALRAGWRVNAHVTRNGGSIIVPVRLAAAPVEHDPSVDTIYGAITVEGSLRRTLLTVPRMGTGRRPAVLFIGGIGCYSVDVAANAEEPYMRLAHDLGRAGFVTLRLEKSGVGDSHGPPCPTVDYIAEAGSYDAALRALRSDAHVDEKRVYLFGHSIGAIIAPRLAVREPVAGVIVAEGVARNWIEYELENTRRQLVLSGSTPADVDARMLDKEWCMHRLLIDRTPEAELEQIRPACKEHNVYPAPAAYFQQLAPLNMAEPWAHLTVPVLAIYGTADYVTAESDHRRIVDIVNARHAGRAQLRIIDGMDHTLMPAASQEAAMKRSANGGTAPYDQRFSGTIVAWLCARERCLRQAPR